MVVIIFNLQLSMINSQKFEIPSRNPPEVDEGGVAPISGGVCEIPSSGGVSCTRDGVGMFSTIVGYKIDS
jgi:hypothetical protein